MRRASLFVLLAGLLTACHTGGGACCGTNPSYSLPTASPGTGSSILLSPSALTISLRAGSPVQQFNAGESGYVGAFQVSGYNQAVISVTSLGLIASRYTWNVTGLSVGTTNITVSDSNGNSNTLPVTVTT